MRKLWALKIGGVQIEEKRKTCFVSMKVFFSNSHWFCSFPIPKQTLGQWKLNLQKNSTINASKVLIMFILVNYFQLSFNYIISPIFWLGSIRFWLGFNYV